MAIQPKRKSVIQKGISFSYHAPTFIKEHKIKNFYEVNTAEEVFKLIKPFMFRGRKMLVMDTEDYPTKIKNHDMPGNVIRRWIGTGKKAVPVDLPFCISICDGINCVTLYDSLANKYEELKKLNVWFEDINIEKIFHNTKFDMHMLFNIGIKLFGRLHDTVVMTKLADENRPSFQLRDLAEKNPHGIVKFEYMVDSFKSQAKVADYREIPRELLSEYANADVWNCFHVFMAEYPRLEADELIELYEKELELMIALWAMERFGMSVDTEYEKPLKSDLQLIKDKSEQEVYDAVGYVFNMNSNAQIFKALQHMGVDKSILKFTDKGNPNLDKKEIERLEGLGIELVVKIAAYRKNEKLLGTYATGIYDQRDSDNKAHGSINQTEATTGRMSITKPALQTLPKKDKRIRKMFIPSPGFSIWFMDLDQIEYRLFAHYAQAQGLIQAIKDGLDVHQATAAIIYNVPYDEVTEEQRTKAKTVNFSLVYGQGNDASAASLKLSMQETRRFKDNYFANIPEALPFIQMVQKITTTRGYVKNFYSRRRRLKPEESYKAPNALIQGCAADYIKNQLVLMYKYLMAYKRQTRLINIVHDELIPEVHDSELFLVPKLRWLMSDFTTFRVPITAGAEVGKPSWGEKGAPDTDVGFDPLTEEEMERTLSFNVFDGSVYDLVS